MTCLILLSACSDDSTPPAKKSTKASNPLSHQVDALNKAKNLEAEMNKAVQERLKGISIN